MVTKKNVEYFLGNSLNLKDLYLKEIGEKVNCIITSPPYYDILDYKHEDQIGFGQDSYADYLMSVTNILQSCYELSTDSATMWLVVDSFRKDGELKLLPFDIYAQLQSQFPNQTWILREVVIWDKEKNLPWSGPGKLRNAFEYIMLFSKSLQFTFNLDAVRDIKELKKWWKSYPERYNPNGKALTNIWTITTAMRGWGHTEQAHLCPFPYKLVERMVSISTNPNDIILDPFAGSGTVLAMASVMNRRAYGFDINPIYKKMFDSEVLHGAGEYWKKRLKEKNNEQKDIDNFRETNNVLRKNKVGAKIIEFYISNFSDKYSIGILKGTYPDNTRVEIFLLCAKDLTTNSLEVLDQEILALIKQVNVSVIVQIADSKIQNTLLRKKYYVYAFNKIYHYVSFEKITFSLKRDNLYYSDLEIKIKD